MLREEVTLRGKLPRKPVNGVIMVGNTPRGNEGEGGRGFEDIACRSRDDCHTAAFTMKHDAFDCAQSRRS
jgi:hypothetical protein